MIGLLNEKRGGREKKKRERDFSRPKEPLLRLRLGHPDLDHSKAETEELSRFGKCPSTPLSTSNSLITC